MARFHLAFALKKTLAEIDEMTVAEFYGWIAFFKARKSEME